VKEPCRRLCETQAKYAQRARKQKKDDEQRKNSGWNNGSPPTSTIVLDKGKMIRHSHVRQLARLDNGELRNCLLQCGHRVSSVVAQQTSAGTRDVTWRRLARLIDECCARKNPVAIKRGGKWKATK
jgi:hypothetical protein